MNDALLGGRGFTGFVGGLFLRTGLDPYGTILGALGGLSIPPYVISILLFSLSILSLTYTLTILKKVHGVGGIVGIIAVGLAFISGLMILDATQEAGYLLVFATILGLFAINMSGKNNAMKGWFGRA